MRSRRHLIGLMVAMMCFLLGALRPAVVPRTYRITGQAQGTTYAITWYADRKSVTQAQIDSVFQSLDASLSIYLPGSLISRFNGSETGIEMDRHLAQVVGKSMQIYRETGGLSDITVYPLVRAWGFGAKAADAMPDSAVIRLLMPCVGSDKLKIEGSRLVKTVPCVQIDVNGIAQGYSVDVLARFLEARGIDNYMVEVGGEIRTRGRKLPGNEPMKIGIETPSTREFDAPVIREVITIGDGAVTTSGSYRKFRESGGMRLSHIIDPRTGFPVQREIISATVVAPEAITADGFDNALLAAGIDGAFEILSAHPGLEAYLIYRKPDGTVADTASAGFGRYVVKTGDR
ncbi:thiamine biosynthesis lipoprotein [Dyadobacter sp. BE34]|uniref:FAD:protein FMN transferase n=1 Tax=Dyadobacter fermentans TaxID=94254 RepID=A0ABU1QW38_9BACT|nr:MULTISPECIES: FAD:protein FMN transferase [Dyadobacter]MDR6805351.1 thiamine biosynthesis lipoprotein [Dyadobacter fermentans]MDR7042889.1 thiamine biosynthesis lipoprotein [Dyadobacter sp. BE242]MDR7197201.1 thiamine biosynthesis lipoprotein [Dyadobacter sp. BE34]MDR7215364.1 thiamine biosynthesis lipoprotein [Dyadobacter sp. BE31]MDR7262900.1 thiamine biosynthesis lipoprotein [Dyadobacter sp. BE32]